MKHNNIEQYKKRVEKLINEFYNEILYFEDSEEYKFPSCAEEFAFPLLLLTKLKDEDFEKVAPLLRENFEYLHYAFSKKKYE